MKKKTGPFIIYTIYVICYLAQLHRDTNWWLALRFSTVVDYNLDIHTFTLSQKIKIKIK